MSLCKKTFQVQKICCFIFDLPVGVGSNLVDFWFFPIKDLFYIGHIKEEKLHEDRRGRGFPWLEHAATFH